MDSIQIPYNHDLYVAVHAIAIPLVFCFGIYAVICGFLDKKTKQADISYFLTAKKSQPIGKITFSFIATMLGSWVFVTPATFAISYGYIGIISVTLTNFFVMQTKPFQSMIIVESAMGNCARYSLLLYAFLI